MGVKGVEITSIEGKRFIKIGEKLPGNIRIDTNSTLVSVNELKGDLVIEFRFTATYVSLGIIKIEGSIIYDIGSRDTSEIIAEFHKTRNLPPKDASAAHNAVMQACIPLAVIISRDIKLPPPIPMPTVKVGPKQKRKGGKGRDDGIEVA